METIKEFLELIFLLLLFALMIHAVVKRDFTQAIFWLLFFKFHAGE